MANANVKVVISAITEAAQSSINEVGDELQEVGVDAKVAKSGMDSVGDEMNETTGSASILNGALGRLSSGFRQAVIPASILSKRIDEVGDQATGSAAEIGILRGSMFALADATDSNILFAGALSSSLSTALIPTLALLLTTLGPLVGSLGVMATALGGVAAGIALVLGTGVIAEFEAIKSQAKSAAKEIRGIAASFGQQFAPMIQNAISLLPSFVRNVLDATGNLQPFKQALRDAGAAAYQTIPKIVAYMADLGRQALPYLRDVAGALQTLIPRAFEASLSAMSQLEQPVTDLIGSLLELNATLFPIGTTVLSQILIPALSQAAYWTSHFLSVLSSDRPDIAPYVNAAASALQTLVSASRRVGEAIHLNFTNLVQFGGVLVTVAANVATALVPALVTLVNILGSVMGFIANPPQALITTFNLLFTAATRIGSALLSVMKATKPLYANLGLLDASILSTANTLIQSAIPAYSKFVSAGISKIATGISTVMPFLLRLQSTALSVGKTIGSTVLAFLRKAATFIQTNLTAALTIASTQWLKHRKTVFQTATKIKNAIFNVLGGAFTFLQTNVTTALNAVGALWKKHRGTVVTILNELRQLILIAATGSYKFLQATATKTLKFITTLWKQHKTKVMAAVTAVNTVLTILWQKIQSLTTPIKSWSAQLKKARTSLLSLANTVRSQVNVSLMTLATTITTLLLPALGGGLIGILTALGLTFRTQIAKGAGMIITKFTSLVGKSKILGKTTTVLSTKFTALWSKITKFIPILGTMSTKLTKLGGRFKFLGVQVKGAANAAILTLRNNFAKLATKLSLMFPLLTKLGGFAKRIGAMLATRLGGPLLTLITRFGRAALTVGRVGSALSLLTNPIGIAVAAIVGLYIAWKKNLFGIRDKTMQIFNALKALIKGDTSKMKGIVQRTAQQIQNLWTKKIRPLLKKTRKILTKLGQAFMKGLNWIMKNAIRPILRSIKKQWDTHGKEIMKGIGQLIDFIKKTIKVGLGIIYTIWDKWGNEIRQTVKFLFDVVGSIVNTAIDALLTAFTAFTDLLAGDIDGALSKIAGFFDRTFNGILSFIQKWVSGFISYLTTDFINAIINLAKDLYNELIGNSIFPDMFNAIISAAKGFVGDVISAFKQLVSDAVSKANDLKRQVVNAIINMGNIAAGKISSFVSGIVSAFQNLVSRAGRKAAALKRKVVNAIIRLGRLAKTKAKNAVDKVIRKLTGAVRRAKNAGKGLIDGFINGIGSKVQAVKNAVGNIMQKVRKRLPGSDADKGPLSDLTASGKALPETIAKGMYKRTEAARKAAEAVASAAKPDLDGTVGRVSSGTLKRELSAVGALSDNGQQQTFNRFRVRVNVSGGATFEDGQNVADGMLSEFRTQGIDTF